MTPDLARELFMTGRLEYTGSGWQIGHDVGTASERWFSLTPEDAAVVNTVAIEIGHVDARPLGRMA